MSSAETVRPSDLSSTLQPASVLHAPADTRLAPHHLTSEKVPAGGSLKPATARLTPRSLAPAPSQAGSGAPSVRPFSRASTAQQTPPRQPKPLVRPVPCRPAGAQSATRPLLGAGHSSRSNHSSTAPNSSSPTKPTRAHSSTPSLPARSAPTQAGPSISTNPARDAPPGPAADELIAFAALCRELYFAKAPHAARLVEATLARLPAASRQAYARTMATVRSQFHADEARARRAAVEDALARAGEGGVLGGSLVAERRGKAARRARAERLGDFLGTYCIKGMVGTHPFCRALHGVLSLQGLEVGMGGPGRRRVEWEVDVAVFTEAGGGDWMKDSIELLMAVSRVERCTPPAYDGSLS